MQKTKQIKIVYVKFPEEYKHIQSIEKNGIIFINLSYHSSHSKILYTL